MHVAEKVAPQPRPSSDYLCAEQTEVPAKEDFVGVWRFVAGYAVEAGSGQRLDLFGPNPRGIAIFEPSGRMMVILEGSNRCAGNSNDELAQLFRSFVAYSGKCSIDGEKFITEVDLASDPSWVGTAQLRYYRFDGQILSLRSAPVEHPAFPGRKAVVYAEWTREESSASLEHDSFEPNRNQR
jgi:hypothetical protein